jgi:hypothetical protein
VDGEDKDHCQGRENAAHASALCLSLPPKPRNLSLLEHIATAAQSTHREQTRIVSTEWFSAGRTISVGGNSEGAIERRWRGAVDYPRW